MGLLSTLQEEMKNAMRARDQVRLDAIRQLISAIKYALVDKPDMDEAEVGLVLAREAKKRREAIEAYTQAGREESAEKERFELAIVETYLPKRLSEEEVRARLKASGVQLTAGMNMGEAMKVAMKAVGAQAEGATVARVVKELLGQ